MLASKTLSLARRGLTSREAAKIVSKGEGDPRDVEDLNVSENALTSHKFVAAFTNLRRLDLSRNNLRAVQVRLLPISLVRLNLSRNQLESVEGLGALASLTELDVSDNSLASIRGASACARLRSLNAAGNVLADLVGVSRLKKLTSLNVARNRIPSIQKIHLLAHNVALTRLDVAGNPLARAGNYRISVFHLLPHIRVLDGSMTPGLGARARAQLTRSTRKNQRAQRPLSPPTHTDGSSGATRFLAPEAPSQPTMSDSKTPVVGRGRLKAKTRMSGTREFTGSAKQPVSAAGSTPNSPGSDLDQSQANLHAELQRLDARLRRVAKRTPSAVKVGKKKSRAVATAAAELEAENRIEERARELVKLIGDELDQASEDDGDDGADGVDDDAAIDPDFVCRNEDSVVLGLALARGGGARSGALDSGDRPRRMPQPRVALPRLMYQTMLARAERQARAARKRHAFAMWRERYAAARRRGLELRLRRRIRTTNTLWSVGLKLWNESARGATMGEFLRTAVAIARVLFAPLKNQDKVLGKDVMLRTHAAVYLANPPSQLILIGAQGEQVANFPFKSGIAGQACATGRAAVARDATAHALYEASVDCGADTAYLQGRTHALRPRLICLPIGGGGEAKIEGGGAAAAAGGIVGPLGAVQFYGLHTSSFDDEDVKLATGFAAQLAAGIAAARLSDKRRAEAATAAAAAVADAGNESAQAVGGARSKHERLSRALARFATKRCGVAARSALARWRLYCASLKRRRRACAAVMRFREKEARAAVRLALVRWRAAARGSALLRRVRDMKADIAVYVTLLLESRQKGVRLEKMTSQLQQKLERAEKALKARPQRETKAQDDDQVSSAKLMARLITSLDARIQEASTEPGGGGDSVADSAGALSSYLDEDDEASSASGAESSDAHVPRLPIKDGSVLGQRANPGPSNRDERSGAPKPTLSRELNALVREVFDSFRQSTPREFKNGSRAPSSTQRCLDPLKLPLALRAVAAKVPAFGSADGVPDQELLARANVGNVASKFAGINEEHFIEMCACLLSNSTGSVYLL